jgi:HEAT repeat protein
MTLTVLCLAAIAGLFFLLLPKREPTYRHVPLSDWLALHRSYQFRDLPFRIDGDAFRVVPERDTLGPEAASAIKQIGTNALPFLIEWMEAPRNSWRTGLAKAFAKLPNSVRPKELSRWLSLSRDYDRASLAYTGFRLLGASAAPAIPDLVKVASDPQALGYDNAVHVLVGLRRPAVPALASLLTQNQPKDLQTRVMQGLGYLGKDASEAVPTLAAYATRPGEELVLISIVTLGRIRQQPEVVVPTLIECLEDSRPGVSLAAAKVLGEYGMDAAPAVPKLQELLTRPDLNLSKEAEQALLRITSSGPVDPFGADLTLQFDGYRRER